MIFAPVLVGLFGLSDIFDRFRVTVGGNTADIGPRKEWCKLKGCSLAYD
jgi:hypothetical protein